VTDISDPQFKIAVKIGQGLIARGFADRVHWRAAAAATASPTLRWPAASAPRGTAHATEGGKLGHDAAFCDDPSIDVHLRLIDQDVPAQQAPCP